MKSLPNIFFREVETQLQKGNSVKIKVKGNSMLPFIRGEQDIIELTTFTPDELKRGKVILFRQGENYIIHRIIGHSHGQFTICGDGNISCCEYAAQEDIIGLLSKIERPSGRIVYCNSWQWRIASEIWIQLFPLRRYLLAIIRRLRIYK